MRTRIRNILQVTVLVATVLVVQACGGTSYPEGGNPDNGAGTQPGQVVDAIYLGDSSDVEQAFAAGFAEFRPDSHFNAFLLLMNTRGDLDGARFQVQDANGDWGEWSPLPIEAVLDVYRNSLVEVPTSIALRVSGVGDLRLAKVQFLSGIAPEEPRDSQATALNAGRWLLPSALAARADGYFVGYDDVEFSSLDDCPHRLTEGAVHLAEYLRREFGDRIDFMHSGIGGENCRYIRGRDGVISMHSTGRALDVHFALDNGSANNQLGDPVANWLVDNAERIGVQYLIWDQSQWTGERSAPKQTAYGYPGSNPHIDHIHLELTLAAAAMGTPFFGTPIPTPAQPDLVIRNVRVEPGSAQAGDMVTVSFDLVNQGDGAAGASTTRLRVNTSAQRVGTGDRLLHEQSEAPLGAGAIRHHAITVRVPGNLASGTHYLWLTADVFDELPQSDRSNDWGSTSIRIRAPEPEPTGAELTVSRDHLDFSGRVGESIPTQSLTLSNQGDERSAFEVTRTPSWLTITPSAGSLRAGDWTTVEVTAESCTRVGTQNSQLRFADADSSVTVTVTRVCTAAGSTPDPTPEPDPASGPRITRVSPSTPIATWEPQDIRIHGQGFGFGAGVVLYEVSSGDYYDVSHKARFHNDGRIDLRGIVFGSTAGAWEVMIRNDPSGARSESNWFRFNTER